MKITLVLFMFSLIINASEHAVGIVDIEDVNHAVSYEAYEINNNSFSDPVVSFMYPEQLEIDPDPIPARVESI